MEKERKSILYRDAFLSLKSAFILLAVIFVAVCLLSLAFMDDIKMADKTVKDIELVSLDGSEHEDVGIFAENKLTVLNVWATFCGPCIREMPEFAEVSHEYADKGVVFIGVCGDISYDKDGKPNQKLLAEAYRIIETTGADYKHYIPSPEYDQHLGELISNSFPGTFIVSPDGEILKLYVGAIEKDVLVSALEHELSGAQDAGN